MLILEARHLQKQFRSRGRVFTAVQDVSLTLGAGEILAFLGPNGAGKTTSIKMVAGLIRPDGGWVRLCDRDPHGDPQAMKLVGAVLEGNRNVYWRMTPQENLEYFGVLRGLGQRRARQRATELLERFDLAHKRRVVVQSLSRGMQQKLAIAVALMHEPPLLLLDEPTLGLDVEATATVKHLIQEIVQAGCAILLTTHQLAIAEELAHRVAIINEAPTPDLLRQFSGSAYTIELAAPLDTLRAQKLAMLRVGVDGTTLHLADPSQLYTVLELLKPLPLLRVAQEQATLTDVFLKLVQENRHA